MLGIIQEQHFERCQLFAQWQQFDWPILHDPINQLELRAVPVTIAIDEHGVVRSTSPQMKDFESFLEKKFDAPPQLAAAVSATRPNIADLTKLAQESNTSKAWRDVGDAHVLWSDRDQIDAAVVAYEKSIEAEAKDAGAHFRLGVALRMRYESASRKTVDFGSAVDEWDRALEIDPNHYIFRRRIQQYGPRLIKPYPFYDWVGQATQEIKARGETPIVLAVEPSGAEIAQPARRFETETATLESPDLKGRIDRDKDVLIEVDAVVVPGRIQPGDAARVHVAFRPSGKSHWNNEAEPLKVWIDSKDGWELAKQLHETAQPKQPESSEVRRVEFECRSPRDASKSTTLSGYALYYVCSDAGGQCLYLRQDFKIEIRAN